MKRILITVLFAAVTLIACGQLDTINVGTAANNGTGESLRSAMLKTNTVIKRLNTLELHNVTSAIQTQLNAKAPLASPALTGTPTVATTLNPDANDGATLGQSGTAFSDAYLANGGVIDFNEGQATISHTASQEEIVVTGALVVTEQLTTGAINTTSNISSTGARVNHGYFTDITLTNPLRGNVRYDSLQFESGDVVDADSVIASYANPLLRQLQELGSDAKCIPVSASAVMSTSAPLADGTAYYVAFFLPRADTITGVKFVQRVQGVYTAADSNYVALYSVSSTTYTKVATSLSNGDLWKGTAYSLQTVEFTEPYVASAGVYMVAFLYNQSAQTTAPDLYAWNGVGGISQLVTGGASGNKIAGSVGSQANLPSEETAADITGTAIVYGVWLY